MTTTGTVKLARLIVEHQPCVALTGAGASTESGIPDFRSPTGIWAEFDPREYATLGAFRGDPEKVWRFYAPRFATLAEAEPNRAHVALAELERRGFLQTVVTQNIDLLHRRAGSQDVVEVHGSIRRSHCLQCGASYELPEVLALLETGAGAPRCVRCGAVLKPGVVFFDELLPEEAMERARQLAQEAQLLLVVGSSLEVYPVADLPRATLEAGGKVAVVNMGATWVDRRAALKLDAGAGETLEAAVSLLVSGGAAASVVDYDPAWPRLYEREAERIREALAEAAVQIEHIGSTSVPGLASKPIIDMAVGLRTLEIGEGGVAAMERLGYDYLGEFGIPGRLFFRKGGARRTHHVHAVEWGGYDWQRPLAFREFLRAHPDEACRYAKEKKRIAEETDGDWNLYWECKQPFVEALFARAWAWHEGHRGVDDRD